MNVSILGTGAFGICLALMLNKNNCNITMWTKFEEEKKELETYRRNDKILPNIVIPSNIKFTNNLEDTIKNSKLIIIAIPIAFIDDLAIEINKYIDNTKHICIASKGINQNDGLFISEILNKHINSENISVISGPSFAIDVAKECPINISIASKNKNTSDIVIKALKNDTFNLEITNDIIGVELCGAIKNVIAIASGIISGMNLSESTLAAFITKSLKEISDVIVLLNGKKETIMTYAGIGDLLLTCTSNKSRNFTLGYMIGQNKTKQEIENYISSTTVEGLYTLISIYNLLKKNNINSKIINTIYNIVFNNYNPKELINFINN